MPKEDEDAKLVGQIACLILDLSDPAEAAQRAVDLVRAATSSTAPEAGLVDREAIAKALVARRWHIDAQAVDKLFLQYACEPIGLDDTRVFIASAFHDADAILALLSPSAGAGEPVAHESKARSHYSDDYISGLEDGRRGVYRAPSGRDPATIENCAKVAETYEANGSEYDDGQKQSIATAIRALAAPAQS